MREVYRVMDANLNRAREGLRVLEEIARFVLDDAELSVRLKEMRHSLVAVVSELPGGLYELVCARDAAGDVGAGSWTQGEKTRDGIFALAAANFKRVQEAARVLEEFGKLFGSEAKEFKKIRFETYILEQEMLEILMTVGAQKGSSGENKKLFELGEFGLIELLTKDLVFSPAGVIRGVGDDTAVLKTGGDMWLLFTTDMMVEGVHFSLEYSTFRQVGWKSLAVNLSDVAAMGGRPSHALVSLAVSPRLRPSELLELYEGLREAAGIHGVNIVGGDTVSSPGSLVLNVSLLGEVEAGKAVYRSGARPGDGLYVTGSLGAPAAGLYLFQNPDLSCSPEAAEYCRRAHTTPQPRVEAGNFLACCGVSSMDDISDGLAREAHEICSAGGVGCLLRSGDVPIDPRVRAVADMAGVDPLDWALFGGEDLELLFTAGPETVEKIKKEAPGEGIKIYNVGEITASVGVFLEEPTGEVRPLKRGGYDHFRK